MEGSIRSRRIKAFSLIEVIVTLMLFVSLLWLWHPLLIQAFRNFQPSDPLIDAIIADDQMTAFAADKHVMAVSDGTFDANGELPSSIAPQLRFKGKVAYIMQYYNGDSGRMIRITTDQGGHMPLFGRVRRLKLKKLKRGYGYHIEFLDGMLFEGVILGAP